MDEDELIVGDERCEGNGGGVIKVVLIVVGMHLLVDRVNALRRLWR